MKKISYLLALMTAGVILLQGCLQEKLEPTQQEEILEIDTVEIVPNEVEQNLKVQVTEPSEEEVEKILAVSAADIPAVQNNASSANQILTDGSVQHVTSLASLRQIARNGNVVIDFYAPWCGPCKLMSPIVDQLARNRTNITFVKVNMDDFDASGAFELGDTKVVVSSIPTFYVFKNGAFVKTLHGGMKKDFFIQEINKFFGE